MFEIESFDFRFGLVIKFSFQPLEGFEDPNLDVSLGLYGNSGGSAAEMLGNTAKARKRNQDESAHGSSKVSGFARSTDVEDLRKPNRWHE